MWMGSSVTELTQTEAEAGRELLAGLWLWGWGLWGCTFSQWGSVLLILPRCLWAGEGLAGGLLASH